MVTIKKFEMFDHSVRLALKRLNIDFPRTKSHWEFSLVRVTRDYVFEDDQSTDFSYEHQKILIS